MTARGRAFVHQQRLNVTHKRMCDSAIESGQRSRFYRWSLNFRLRWILGQPRADDDSLRLFSDLFERPKHSLRVFAIRVQMQRIEYLAASLRIQFVAKTPTRKFKVIGWSEFRNRITHAVVGIRQACRCKPHTIGIDKHPPGRQLNVVTIRPRRDVTGNDLAVNKYQEHRSRSNFVCRLIDCQTTLRNDCPAACSKQNQQSGTTNIHAVSPPD